MRKFSFLVVLTVLAGVAAMAFAEGLPEKFTLDECAHKKPPVVFPHKAHFDKTDCVTCHHQNEGLTLENYAEKGVKKCAECHLNPEKAETPKCTSSSQKSNPFHIRCVGCHKETKKKDAETKAPTKCKQCHVKVAAK